MPSSTEEEVVWPIERVYEERTTQKGERQLRVQWGGLTKAGTPWKPQWLPVDKISPEIVQMWEEEQEWQSADFIPPVRPDDVDPSSSSPIPALSAFDSRPKRTLTLATATASSMGHPEAIHDVDVSPHRTERRSRADKVASAPHRPLPELIPGTCDDRHMPFRLVSHTIGIAPCQGRKHSPHNPHFVCDGCHKQWLESYLTQAEEDHMVKDHYTFPLCRGCADVRSYTYEIRSGQEVNCCACVREGPNWLCAECWVDWIRERSAKRVDDKHCPCGVLLTEDNTNHAIHKCSGCDAPVAKKPETWQALREQSGQL